MVVKNLLTGEETTVSDIYISPEQPFSTPLPIDQRVTMLEGTTGSILEEVIPTIFMMM